MQRYFVVTVPDDYGMLIPELTKLCQAGGSKVSVVEVAPEIIKAVWRIHAELAFPRKPRARLDDELKSLYPNPGKYP